MTEDQTREILAIDETMLGELVELMGPEAFEGAFASFVTDLGESLRAVEAASAATDEAAIRRHAHRIKGILSQFGVPGGAAFAFSIETASGPALFERASRLATLVPSAIEEVRRMASMISSRG